MIYKTNNYMSEENPVHTRSGSAEILTNKQDKKKINEK